MIYREKISFSTPGGNHVAGAPLPPGKVKTDEYFGEVEIFEFDFVVPVTLDTEAETVRLEVSYQGCAEDGICYSPVSKTFDLLPQQCLCLDRIANRERPSPMLAHCREYCLVHLSRDFFLPSRPAYCQ